MLKPVATGYADYTPAFVRTGIGNFFGNLGDVWTSVNNYLQLKPREGTQDVARVIFNSTFGLVGLIDVAKGAVPVVLFGPRSAALLRRDRCFRRLGWQRQQLFVRARRSFSVLSRRHSGRATLG